MTTTSASTTLSNLSGSARRKVYTLAEQFPRERREAFVQDLGSAIEDIKYQHPDTFTYTLMGWVLGEIVDNVLVLPIPFKEEGLKIFFDHASTVGGVVGFLKGNRRDREVRRMDACKKQMREEMTEEFACVLSEVFERHLNANTGDRPGKEDSHAACI